MQAKAQLSEPVVFLSQLEKCLSIFYPKVRTICAINKGVDEEEDIRELSKLLSLDAEVSEECKILTMLLD